VDRCALFVDAGYALSDGADSAHGRRRRESFSWDYPGLLSLLADIARERTGLPVLRCYWYDANDEGIRSAEHERLAEIPGLKLRLRRARPGRRDGIEADLKRDLMTLARNGAISDALIVTADDYVTDVVAEAQDHGIRICVAEIAADGGRSVPVALRQECDQLIELSAGSLRRFAGGAAGARARATGERSGAGQPAGTGQPAATCQLSGIGQPVGTGERSGTGQPAGTGQSTAVAAARHRQHQSGATPAYSAAGDQLTPVGVASMADYLKQLEAAGSATEQAVLLNGASRAADGTAVNGQPGPVPNLAPLNSLQSGINGTASADGHPDAHGSGSAGTGRADPGRSAAASGFPAFLNGFADAPIGFSVAANGPGVHSYAAGMRGGLGGPGSADRPPGPVNGQAGSGDGSAQRPGGLAGPASGFPLPAEGLIGPANGQPVRGEGLIGPANGQPVGLIGPANGQPMPGHGPSGPANGLAVPAEGVSGPVNGRVGPASEAAGPTATPTWPAADAADQPPGMAGSGGVTGQSAGSPGHNQWAGGAGLVPGSAGFPNGRTGPAAALPSPAPGRASSGRTGTGGLLAAPPNGHPRPEASRAGPTTQPAAASAGLGSQWISLQPDGRASSSPGLAVPASQSAGSDTAAGYAGPPAYRQAGYGADPLSGRKTVSGPDHGSASQLGHTATGRNVPPPAGAPPLPARQPAKFALADAVRVAHREGHSFGETVARDAPSLWLDAVLARKPRMPSDLEARLLQGSALPIDSLLHEEVRQALRRGFWAALEGTRR
jgi:hypothetical protein